jgi:hypothetical protein
VRETSVRSLRALDRSDAGDLIVPHLASDEPEHRVRASDALVIFPSAQAPGALIAVGLRLAWADFGRGYFFQGTERAYIADYELVSGGTGFSIIEVADPVVRRLSTGVALDVDVQKVEQTVHLRNLRALTGEDHGEDFAAWKSWWEEKERAAAASRASAEHGTRAPRLRPR